MIDGRVGMFGQHWTASLFDRCKLRSAFSVVESYAAMVIDCNLFGFPDAAATLFLLLGQFLF
jgi:hypothetical protein